MVYSSDYGRISGNTKELAQWTVRNNQALSRAMVLMSEFANRWRIGDWNHGSYDTATEDITSGTREIALTNPQDILFIFKVLILQSATATDYTQIYPFDLRERGTQAYAEDDASYTGVPFRYEKVGGYISLAPKPNYSATDGLKYYYQRAPHQFTTADTTATAGIPSVFDQLIPLYAVDQYATENTNPNLKALVNNDIARMEADIKNFFRQREEDRVPQMMAVKRSSR